MIGATLLAIVLPVFFLDEPFGDALSCYDVACRRQPLCVGHQHPGRALSAIAAAAR